MIDGIATSLDAPGIEGVIERHRTFWQRGHAERPLTASPRRLAEEHPVAGEGHELTPVAVLRGIRAGLDELEQSYARHGVLDGDLFRCIAPPGAPPWMPALLGCRLLRASPSSRHLRIEPLAGGWEALQKVELDVAWHEALLEGMELLAARFGGRYPIAAWHERGPVDMLAQALGEGEMALRVTDDPAEVRRVPERLTGLWVEVGREVLDRLPPFAGGTFQRYGLWAPGRLVAFTTDASALLSPGLYRELFLPFDRQIAAAFDHVLIHTHSASAQHYAAWAEIPGAALHITDDPVAPVSWQELLRICARLQETGHPLLLQVQEKHMQDAWEQLSPRGLIVRPYVS
ncbi:MAG: hypothetical protein H5T69_00455 [Chloroflexi bacterium]|nr:hypothetical protein [Chloroflexota bacterium]